MFSIKKSLSYFSILFLSCCLYSISVGSSRNPVCTSISIHSNHRLIYGGHISVDSSHPSEYSSRNPVCTSISIRCSPSVDSSIVSIDDLIKGAIESKKEDTVYIYRDIRASTTPPIYIDKNNIVAIVIGLGVKAIEDEEFKNYAGLQQIFMHSEVIRIGSETFSGRTKLTSVVLKGYVLPDIADDAFVDFPVYSTSCPTSYSTSYPTLYITSACAQNIGIPPEGAARWWGGTGWKIVVDGFPPSPLI